MREAAASTPSFPPSWDEGGGQPCVSPVLATTSYHYDGSEVAVEYQPAATWTYYLGLGIDQPVMRINGTTKQWYYADAQGSISAVADTSGNLLEAYEYNPQGQVQVTNTSGAVNRGSSVAACSTLMSWSRN